MATYKTEIYGKIGEQARLHPAYALLVPVVAVFLFGIAQGIAMVPVILANPEMKTLGNSGLVYSLAVGFGVGALAVFAWVKWVENRTLASMGWRFERAFSRYGRGFVIGLVLNVSAIALIWLFGGYTAGAWLPAFSSAYALGMIALLLFGFIIQGGTEEILTRGWMMSTMASRWGVPIAIGVTSSLFAALHLPNEWPHINWIAMVNIVLVGVFFALFAMRERSLIGVCAIHSAWNWIMGVGFGLNVSGMKLEALPLVVELQQKPEIANWITGGSFGPEGSITVTLVLGLATLLTWRWKGEDMLSENETDLQT